MVKLISWELKALLFPNNESLWTLCFINSYSGTLVLITHSLIKKTSSLIIIWFESWLSYYVLGTDFARYIMFWITYFCVFIKYPKFFWNQLLLGKLRSDWVQQRHFYLYTWSPFIGPLPVRYLTQFNMVGVYCTEHTTERSAW